MVATSTSTIIVNWNTKDFLLGCIKSLKPYLNPNLDEIIVVDNASSDGSVAAIHNLYPDVIVIACTTNLGFAKANNLAMRQARGAFIFLVNSDIVMRNDCYSTILEYFRHNVKVAAVAPRLLNPDGTIQPGCWRFPSLGRAAAMAIGLNIIFPASAHFSEGYSYSDESPQNVDVACGAFLAVRKSTIDEVGLFDEGFYFYGEDVDWCWRFARAGYHTALLPSGRVVHFGGQSSSKAPLYFAAQLTRAHLQLFRKYYPASMSIILRMILFVHYGWRLFAHYIVALNPHRRPASIHAARMCSSALSFILSGKLPSAGKTMTTAE